MSGRRVRASRPVVVALALLVALGSLVVSGTVHAPPAQAVPQLPAGFTLTSTPSGQGEFELTDFAYLPDGSVITIGKSGKVAWVSTTGTVRTLAELPVTTVQDLGLVGLAVAPDYETSRTIYLARALPGTTNNWPLRLSRHTVTGSGEPTGLADEVTLLETTATSDVHAITGIVAAGDGTLWVSVGDAADFRFVDPAALRSLDVNDPRGKVLHIDGSNGAGVPGNPFYDATDPGAARSKVYATGFRSPLRLTLDPGSGNPVLGDVGWNTFEEVDLVRPGASYGWPCFEANAPTPGYRDLTECAGQTNTAPLHFYDRPSGNGSSVTGGVFYTGQAYPAAYRGSYFFGDYTSGRVWTMAIGPDGAVTRPPEDAGFGREMGGPVSFERGPNGDIAYADILDGTIKRISYASPNRALAPVTTTGPAIRTVAVQQDIPGGTPPANNAPELALYRPSSGEVYAVGDVVTATATGTDAEDGPLPVQWSTVAMHCRAELCHAHPGPRSSGNDFSMVFSDHGDDTEQHITATVTDSAGVSTSRTFVARPDLRTLTVSTSVPATTTINGVERSSAEVTRGARVSVSVAATASDGVSTFESWSDGGARAHDLVVGAEDIALTARYRAPGDQR
ncbi:MAG: PQQ-dependent sugar dehydrogenase [Actinomycetota bacterium]|nr:PQQ-dependent sugar dehydrogenase [Actinomycetota bacterium]